MIGGSLLCVAMVTICGMCCVSDCT